MSNPMIASTPTRHCATCGHTQDDHASYRHHCMADGCGCHGMNDNHQPEKSTTMNTTRKIHVDDDGTEWDVETNMKAPEGAIGRLYRENAIGLARSTGSNGATYRDGATTAPERFVKVTRRRG